MKNSLSQWLVRYGLFVMGLAILAVMYEPESGQVGFNPAAKTALISGGICGGLSILWGMLLGRGFQWARIAAMVSTFLFIAAFTWRAIAGWMACAGGQPEKWFAATLITCIWAGTLGLLAILVRNRTASAPVGNAREPVEIRKQPGN